MTGQTPLIERTAAVFCKAFGHEPMLLAFAPGRVNLIGDHTDYNDGFALPCALQYGTAVAVAPLDEPRIVAMAADMGDAIDEFATDLPIARLTEGQWQNHVRGIVAGLAQFGFPVRGARIVISGDIKQGNGLSSSASLGIALALGLSALPAQGPQTTQDRLMLARIAQWAEHEYVGSACGLMDQIASAFGQPGNAMLLDCRSLAIEPVAFPADAAILIVPSGVVRGLVGSAYNDRRAQCARAAAHFGVLALRDLDMGSLQAKRAGCDDVIYRRARHVVTENARTLAAVKAMASGDLIALGAAMRASHSSLRDDFAVSVPAVDALVAWLNQAIGAEGGARMTGGGFGGCVVAVLAADRVDAVHQALAAYWRQAGMEPQTALLAQPSAGAALILNAKTARART